MATVEIDGQPFDVRRIDRTETTSIIKSVLNEEFPEVKFSVRSKSYSGGGSISVHWVNGPTKPELEEIVRPYEDRGFDGMIDCEYQKYTWLLPDGTAVPAYSNGTTGTNGTMNGYKKGPPSEDAELVSTGSGYIHYSRGLTLEMYRKLVECVCDHFDDWAGDETVPEEEREKIEFEEGRNRAGDNVTLCYKDDESARVLREYSPPWDKHGMNLGQEISRHQAYFSGGDYVPSDV